MSPGGPGSRTRRGTYGRVVLLGLAAAGLAAFGGHQTWVGVSSDDTGAQALADATLTSGTGVGESPAAGALALVCLACWGVLLVTRGRVRRAISVLGLVASLGTVAVVVVDGSAVTGRVRDALGASPSSPFEVGLTAWFWAAAVGALASVGLCALAVRLVPSWPEMGTRYDTPAGGPAPVAPLEEQTNLDLWKSIDQGRDPTA